MLAAPKLEHGGARQRRVPHLAALVDRALLGAGDHRPVKKETRRHRPTPLRRLHFSQPRLRIGLHEWALRKSGSLCRRGDWRTVRNTCMEVGKAGLSFEMNKLMGRMKPHSGALPMFAALAGLSAAPAIAQIQPMGAVPPAPVRAQPKGPAKAAPDAPVPGNPD